MNSPPGKRIHNQTISEGVNAVNMKMETGKLALLSLLKVPVFKPTTQCHLYAWKKCRIICQLHVNFKKERKESFF